MNLEPAPLPAPGPVEVLLVVSEGCHFCGHARDVLDALAREYPVSVREIDLTSPEGAAAARRFRVPFPPVVLVDGELFGYGRISERKLRNALAHRFPRERSN